MQHGSSTQNHSIHLADAKPLHPLERQQFNPFPLLFSTYGQELW